MRNNDTWELKSKKNSEPIVIRFIKCPEYRRRGIRGIYRIKQGFA